MDGERGRRPGGDDDGAEDWLALLALTALTLTALVALRRLTRGGGPR